MTATATTTDPVTIEALDFALTCQIEHWYIFVPEQAKPACGKPATHTATVHNFHTCAGVEKFVCDACLQPLLRAQCASCQAARITNVHPLRGTL